VCMPFVNPGMPQTHTIPGFRLGPDLPSHFLSHSRGALLSTQFAFVFFVDPSYHTTHTTKAERRAQESPRRQRRQRVARRPKVASCFIFLHFLWVNSVRLLFAGEGRISLYKILFHFKALLWEAIIPLLPPSTYEAYPSALLWHDHCAIYAPPPTPPFYATHHTMCW